jgi:4-hydroxy-tetrahydrodipicolinate synthase
MTSDGKVDEASLARLLAHFEAKGCQGVVLAGTNGEGPSLSAIEKRDLCRNGVAWGGKLDIILGIATPSLEEAIWSSNQAGKTGAKAVLVMPPSYFRSATEEGILQWFLRLADATETPILAYNFPKMTGFTMKAEFLTRLAEHPTIIGFKDSSGEQQNLIAYRQAIPPEKLLFVGAETLLAKALEAGWTGTISGAANCIPDWLGRVVEEWGQESATVVFDQILPIIEAIRSLPQPAGNKDVLHRLGVIESSAPRLPLQPVKATEVLDLMQKHLGIVAPRS